MGWKRLRQGIWVHNLSMYDVCYQKVIFILSYNEFETIQSFGNLMTDFDFPGDITL